MSQQLLFQMLRWVLLLWFPHVNLRFIHLQSLVTINMNIIFFLWWLQFLAGLQKTTVAQKIKI